jgi:hypothetical protein
MLKRRIGLEKCSTLHTPEINGFYVVHPLDDIAEGKCSSIGLGKIRMTRAVHISLGVLRAYLVMMTLMLAYHVLDLAGVLQKIR